jgi:hypothetical protein
MWDILCSIHFLLGFRSIVDMDPTTSLLQMCPLMICSCLFLLILLNWSLLYVSVIVSSCCLIKYVTHLCLFSILRQLTRLCPYLFGYSWWNRQSLCLCSFPHQSNKEHSFLFVMFLVSCVQLSSRDLLQRRVFPVVVVRT